MVSETNLKNTRETVIIVADASRRKMTVNALDWALEHVARRKDTIIVIAVRGDIRKKINFCHCFPSNMEYINFSGTWELSPRDIGEEIERLREQFKAILKPFNQKCKRNEVNLEAKLAVGICASEISIKEAAEYNARWIVLDSRFKKHGMCIYSNVECNVAVMEGKDGATLMLSRANEPDDRPPNGREIGNPNAVGEGESDSSRHPSTEKASISLWNDGRVQLKQRLKAFFMSVKDNLCK